jgi:hypothetical protein
MATKSVSTSEFKEMVAAASNNGDVTDETCFNKCEWIEGLTICRNCVYIVQSQGNVTILNPAVKGRFNVFDRMAPTVIQTYTPPQDKDS